jgi:tight adherence protein C
MLGEFGSEEEQQAAAASWCRPASSSRHALEIFNGVRITLAIVLPMIVAPGRLEHRPDVAAIGVTVASLAGYGVLPAPLMVKNAPTSARRTCFKSFPDALDLLVSCVEAGLGLDAAFRRVCRSRWTRPRPSVEGVPAGEPRDQRGCPPRRGACATSSGARASTRSAVAGEHAGPGGAVRYLDRQGPPRALERMTRQKRMARAEEEAAKVSPKLTVIMILTLLPVLGMVLMGPALIRVYRLWSVR